MHLRPSTGGLPGSCSVIVSMWKTAMRVVAALPLALTLAACSRGPDSAAQERMTQEQAALLSEAGIADFDPRGTLAAALQRADDRAVRDLLVFTAAHSPDMFQQIVQLRPNVRLDGVNRSYNDSPVLVEIIRSGPNPESLLTTAPAILAKGGRVDDADGAGVTALHAAAFRGSPALVRMLLDMGASIAATDRQGQTVLHHAVANGSAEVMRLLLDRGAAAGALDHAGRTAMHTLAASQRASVEAAAVLIAAGTPFDTPDTAGFYPLDMAIEAGQIKLVEELLKAGAEVNRDNARGTCPLFEAMVRSRAVPHVAVELLLRYGADPDFVMKKPDYASRNGGTPRARAAYEGVDRQTKALFQVD